MSQSRDPSVVRPNAVVRGLALVASTADALAAPHRDAIRKMSLVLFWIVAGLIVWDVVLAMDPEDHNTWSERARAAAFRLPVLPWFLGALMAHLFPILPRPVFRREAAAGLMGVLTGLAVLWSLAIGLTPLSLSGPAVWLTALAGMVAAFLFWPMAEPADAGEGAA